MLFDKQLRRDEEPWEVVDLKNVAPVSMWDEEEDLDVVRVHGADVTVKFVHELRGAEDLRKAVLYARARVLQDAARLNCNVLLSEGWSCTLMRQGRRHRVEVVYSGRPARAQGTGTVARARAPPFLGVLDHCEQQVACYQAPPRRRLFRSWSRSSSGSA